ncbi:hypothetical protein BC463_09285 [Neisseria meningitidis]|nr:hypothetical protein BC463_09285 [Neisseria meningitidis]
MPAFVGMTGCRFVGMTWCRFPYGWIRHSRAGRRESGISMPQEFIGKNQNPSAVIPTKVGI